MFIPLTTFCRDYCGYCTFRRDPGEAGEQTTTEIGYTSYVRKSVARGAGFTVSGNQVVPAEAVTSRLEWQTLALAAGFAVVLFGITRWFWRFGLKNYSGASA